MLGSVCVSHLAFCGWPVPLAYSPDGGSALYVCALRLHLPKQEEYTLVSLPAQAPNVYNSLHD